MASNQAKNEVEVTVLRDSAEICKKLAENTGGRVGCARQWTLIVVDML